MRFVKPIDQELLHQICNKFSSIITIEDGTIVGGFGSAVIEFINEKNYHTKVNRLGVPDKFIEHGTQHELYRECGFDEDSIYQTVKSIIISDRAKNIKSVIV